MFNYDPQIAGPQYLEDLATGYWLSEVLFTAVEMDLFSYLESNGQGIIEITERLQGPKQGIQRFLQTLCTLGLITTHDQVYYNTKLSSKYLVKGKKNYQGDSILWRKYLTSCWQDLRSCLEQGGRVKFSDPNEDSQSIGERIRKYIYAMDNVARTKVEEIVPFFIGIPLEGELLDVGAGSGAITAGFLKAFPLLQATLMDIPEVLEYTRELMQKQGFQQKVAYCQANILEKWSIKKDHFDLVILSNIVHAYSEPEITHILEEAVQCLKPDGFLLIHDFFLEHFPAKAALSDLNMFINTYNGKVFNEKWVRETINNFGLQVTDLIPLKSDTGVLIAARSKENLQQVKWDSASRLAVKIEALGFNNVYPISPEIVQVPDWADQRCRFGCSSFGKPHCPPNSPTPEKTRNVLKAYSKAFLLEGEPPTGDFQKLVLEAEKLAFKTGFHKAFSYWAGPCSLCSVCTTDGVCKNTKEARPSMESAGIDVFETVRRAGISLQTLDSGEGFVKYFGLLVLE